MNSKVKDSFDGPYLSLKFGNIKGGNFFGNQEARHLLDTLDMEKKENMIKVIKAFNGSFYLWWEQRFITKKNAIAYVNGYLTNPPL